MTGAFRVSPLPSAGETSPAQVTPRVCLVGTTTAVDFTDDGGGGVPASAAGGPGAILGPATVVSPDRSADRTR